MSDTTPFGFGRFVPGFDFLQNLAKGTAAGMPGMSAMPALSGWVAPTVSVEELDKRIQELKAVQFWLEQNARALSATVQAMEVQKMTLATLKGMNVALGDLAGVFSGGARAEEPRAAAPAPVAPPPAPAAPPEPEPEPRAQPKADAEESEAKPAPGVIDPMQWWGALTSQFQQIAANAVKDVGSQQAAFETTRDMASGAFRKATDMAVQLATQGMKGTRAAAEQSAKPAAPKKAAPAARKKAAPAAKKKAPAAKARPARD